MSTRLGLLPTSLEGPPVTRFLISRDLQPSFSAGKVVAEVPIDEAAARDVLLLEGDREVVRGLEAVLTEAGLRLTAVADIEVARDQITHRFFAVVMFDLDIPRPLGGLDLLAFVKQA